MSLHQQIKEDIKTAMKDKNKEKVTALKGLSSAMMNEAMSAGKQPNEELTDEEALTVLKRETKRRKDAINQYEQGGRDDLVEGEKKELEIIESYLPEQASEEDIRRVVQEKKEELGISDMSGMGDMMKAVMAELTDADGATVKKIVEEELS